MNIISYNHNIVLKFKINKLHGALRRQFYYFSTINTIIIFLNIIFTIALFKGFKLILGE